MQVYHELSPIYDVDSKVLILGSMPSVKSREVGFYYAHKTNRFWFILEKLFNVNLNTIDEKKKFLLDKHIALWDVFEFCEIDASSDASIKNYKLKLYLAYQNYNIDFLYLRQKIKKSGFPNFFIYILTTFNLLKHV